MMDSFTWEKLIIRRDEQILCLGEKEAKKQVIL